MTRARTASYGLVTPPPLYRWIDAVLMLFAELVSYAVSTLQMVLVRRTRECHTTASPEDLPRATSGLHQETDQAAQTGLSTGSGLSAASPAKAGVQTPHSVRTRNPSALRALTGPPPSRGTRVEKALSAHPDERRDQGRTANRVLPCSFKPAPASKPFLDSDGSS